MLRKTKLYLDKTIKVESTESTSHTGNRQYKEASVLNRPLGRGGGGSGLRGAAEPAPGKPGIVLGVLLGEEGRDGLERDVLCFPPLSHGCELRLCSVVVPRAPPDGLRCVAGCWLQQLVCYPQGWASLFCFTRRSASSHPRCSFSAREYLT